MTAGPARSDERVLTGRSRTPIPADVRQVGAAATEFAVDLHPRVTAQELGNVVLAPHVPWLTRTMTMRSAAAADMTHTDFLEALRLAFDEERLLPASQRAGPGPAAGVARRRGFPIATRICLSYSRAS